MDKISKFFDNFPFITFLKGQWIFFWNWIKLAHSSSDEASSKRLYGGLTILSCIISYFLFAAGTFDINIWSQLAPYWTFLLLLGTGLLSISTLEKISLIIANFKIKALTEDKKIT